MKKTKLWKVNIPLESGTRNKGFAIFGNIELLIDELKVIYDWKLTASKLHIDRMVNPLWKEKKNKAFLYREELFRYARIDAQFDRPRNWRSGQEQVSQAIVLTGTTFERVLEWFNNGSFFPKQDIMLLGDILNGEAGNSKEAAKNDELVYTRYFGAQIPFSVLLRDHIGIEPNSYQSIKKLKESASIVDVFTFAEWCNRSPNTIGKWADMLSKTDLTQKIGVVESQIRSEAKTHFIKAKKVHTDCEKAIAQFEKNIVKKYEDKNPIFDVTTLVKNKWNEIAEQPETFELIHIYPVWKIKQDLMHAKTSAEKTELLGMISDITNLMPLNYFGAEMFERGEIFFEQDGHMRMTTVNFSKAKQLYGYHIIPPEKLTARLKKYFELHRDLHGADPFKYIAKKLGGRKPRR